MLVFNAAADAGNPIAVEIRLKPISTRSSVVNIFISVALFIFSSPNINSGIKKGEVIKTIKKVPPRIFATIALDSTP